jgi:hypothetical protein
VIDGFHREALAWAAGGRGKPLVDAAAEALAVGLDSPSLRMLAGATKATSDEEADQWAAKTFQELGLAVADRFSAEAVIAFARMRAWEFLQARGSVYEESPRSLAAEFYGYYVRSDYAAELATWSGIDDEFVMLGEGVFWGSPDDIMPDLIAELEQLCGRKDPRLPSGLFRVATNLDQLQGLTDALAFESAQPDCSWENSNVGSYVDAFDAWLNDVRSGPWIANNLGRDLPDEVWVSVRDAVREAFGEPVKSIGSLLRSIADGDLTAFGDDEFWLLSNALLAAAIYE